MTTTDQKPETQEQRAVSLHSLTATLIAPISCGVSIGLGVFLLTDHAAAAFSFAAAVSIFVSMIGFTLSWILDVMTQQP